MLSNLLTQIRPITQEERLRAKQNAARVIMLELGECPSRKNFTNHVSSEYPPQIVFGLTFLTLLALVSAFATSAIRLYHIGAETFGHAINHPFSMQVAGISIVILAEAAQIVFSLTLAVYDASRLGKQLLYISMGMATTIALIGNIQLALPGQWLNPFAWLEAIFPSVMVLSLAYVLKEQMLQFIRQRHANEQAYQAALAQWGLATANPESHPEWEQFYANALREAIIEANKRRKSINLSELSSSDWVYLVRNAMNSDNWFLSPDEEPQEVTTPEKLVETQSALLELPNTESITIIPSDEREVEVDTPPYPLEMSLRNGQKQT